MRRAIARVTSLPAVVPATPTEAQIWANLRQYAVDARGAFAANTEHAIKADIATFTAWCHQAGHQAMPASPETVARFVDAMAECRASATVRRYISSIVTFHHAGQVQPNPAQTRKVSLRLKAMHNAKGRTQRQADPLNEGLIRDLLRPPERGLADIRNKAILVLAYSGLLRRAEIVQLRFEDVTVEKEDGFGTVLLRKSKSDQEGLGAIVPIPSDAMRYVTEWIERAGVESGALFRAVRASGSVGGALSPIDVNRIYKAMARRARLPAEAVAGISGHGPRIGAAQDMLRAKEQMPNIMAAGRWKSPAMVAAYTRKVAARDSAAKRLADAREPF